MFSVAKNSDTYTSLGSQNLPETIARAVDLVGKPEFSAVIASADKDHHSDSGDVGKKIRQHFLNSTTAYYGEAVWVGACFKPLDEFSLRTYTGDFNRSNKTYLAKNYHSNSPDFEMVFTHIFETKHSINVKIKAVSNFTKGKFSLSKLGKTSDTVEISTWTSQPLMDSEAAQLMEAVFTAKQQGLPLNDIFKLADNMFGKELNNQSPRL